MNQAILPLWIQLVALFGLPALGTYVGIRTGLVRMETRMEAFKDQLGNHAAEIGILRKRSHQHSGLLGRLALKAKLSSGLSIEEDG